MVAAPPRYDSMDLSVDYSPADRGDDAGTLEVTSDDPDQQLVSVKTLARSRLIAMDPAGPFRTLCHYAPCAVIELLDG